MTPTITIIVPVYNAEAFLNQCINTILNQSFSDLELLLIDDGGTDRSGVVCDEWAAKDSRVKVFHKANGGASSARNLGIENAKGEWVTFVDADDWLGENYLSELIGALEKTQCNDSMILCGFTKVDFTTGVIIESEAPYRKRYYNLDRERDALRPYKLDILKFNFTIGKLIRRSVLWDNHIRFKEDINYLEDLIFWLECLSYIQNVTTVDGKDYFYRVNNPNSGSFRKLIPDNEYKIFNHLKNNLSRLQESHQLTGEDIREVKNAAYQYVWSTCRATLNREIICAEIERISWISSKFSIDDFRYNLHYRNGSKVDLLFGKLWVMGLRKAALKFYGWWCDRKK
ncbi:MAG: glycosyltransferase [Bacteroidales bacterium]|nr:glycosyltransferase [Bacteroidales bacterium]